jgi:MoaA/NifB/PqqE/SkfB family radical SAM enzyme
VESKVLTTAAPSLEAPLRSLPLLTLYLTERCNSRCVACDYWLSGHRDMTLESVARRLPDLAALGTQIVLFSGGEPLLNPDWAAIAALLRASGLRIWLLTSGLALAKHAARVAELFEAVTVSLDGARPSTYAAIRGLDAFDTVCRGIARVAGRGVPVGVRVTVQRANYRELPELVEVARSAGAGRVSFLAADVGNINAFGRTATHAFANGVALQDEDLPELELILDRMQREHAADFRAGFIAESPQKLRRILQYYAALRGRGPFPPVRCNAPEFSAVLEAGGGVRPCFFIAGPERRGASHQLEAANPAPDRAGLAHAALEHTTRPARDTAAQSLRAALNDPAMTNLRKDIRAGRRAECTRCVCSMWRDASSPRWTETAP